MTYDSIILAAIIAELNNDLAGGRVDKIHQPTPLDVVLTIRNNGANYMLLLSADAQSPRIHLTSAKRPNPQTPPNFCMLMRKYLEGGRLVGIEQVDFDRIAHVKFSAYDGERITLVVEIMGKHSNVIMIGDTGRILGAAKPVGRTKNRYREILPGRDYIPPPSQNKADPLHTSVHELQNMLSQTYQGSTEADMASWLTKTFTGMSPFAARELATRSAGDTAALPEEFADFFTQVKARRFMPVFLTDDAGHTTGFYPFPSVQYPPSNQHERSSINSVADAYYTSELPRLAFEQAKQEFITGARRELEAREHALEAIQEGIEESEGAERYKQLGELILSQPTLIHEGAECAELVDYYDPNGATVTVDLDPKLTVPENAEAYFRRFRKALSGAEVLKDRQRETEGEMKLLRRVLNSVDSVVTIEQVRELQGVLSQHGIQFRKQEAAAVQEKHRKPEFEGQKIGRSESSGWEILFGQNMEANDYLLNRVARPNDIWLHVKAAPSAHVVIRTNNKPDAVPRSVLYAAAEIAARHSDAKHSSLIPVDYTQRKYVRKQKGAGPGKALYQNEKTIYVEGL